MGCGVPGRVLSREQDVCLCRGAGYPGEGVAIRYRGGTRLGGLKPRDNVGTQAAHSDQQGME